MSELQYVKDCNKHRRKNALGTFKEFFRVNGRAIECQTDCPAEYDCPLRDSIHSDYAVKDIIPPPNKETKY